MNKKTAVIIAAIIVVIIAATAMVYLLNPPLKIDIVYSSKYGILCKTMASTIRIYCFT